MPILITNVQNVINITVLHKNKYYISILVGVFLLSYLFLYNFATQASILPPPTSQSEDKKPKKLPKVTKSFKLDWFKKNGYKDFIEPKVSFIKRKKNKSEVIEYSYRPMLIHDMPNKERIDRIQSSYNFYFFPRSRKHYYGVGIGANIILFSNKLKEWALANRNKELKNGVHPFMRFIVGHKITDFKFNNFKYPLYLRLEHTISPAYKFHTELGKAGDKLELTEFRASISIYIE